MISDFWIPLLYKCKWLDKQPMFLCIHYWSTKSRSEMWLRTFSGFHFTLVMECFCHIFLTIYEQDNIFNSKPCVFKANKMAIFSSDCSLLHKLQREEWRRRWKMCRPVNALMFIIYASDCTFSYRYFSLVRSFSLSWCSIRLQKDYT